MPSRASNHSDPYYAAQDILSRRDHSEAEVRAKMKRKGFSSPQINDVITWLKNKNLVNDAEFARKYIEYTLELKAVGPRWLEHKLRLKQVPAQYIDAALAEACTGSRETEIARKATASWKRLHPQHQSDRNRLQRFLASRGFSLEAIYAVLD